MKRRMMILFLVLCVVCTAFAFPVRAAKPIASGSWLGGYPNWKISANGTLTLSGNRYMQGSSTYDYPWLKYADQVKKIVVGNGITNIADGAFYEMDQVTEVKLSNTLEEIGVESFRGCTKLKSVAIPASVDTIGEAAFFLCDELESVTFSEDSRLTSIEGGAFQNTALTAIDIPDGVTTIPRGTFYECTALESVTLPEHLELIDREAFYKCESLKSLVIPATLQTIRTDAFYCCYGLTTMELYANVDYEKHFSYSPIESILVHDNLTEFTGFENCTTLTQVSLPDTITTIGRDAFRGCTALTEIRWPKNLTRIGRDAFSRTGMTEVVIPDTVTEMDCAFRSCPELISFTCGSGLEELADCALHYCPKLTTVDLGQIKYLGFEALADCSSLTTVKMSQNLESIGYQALAKCTALERIIFPKSLKTLSHSIFTGSKNLKEVVFLGDAPSIDSYIFHFTAPTVYYPAGNATWTEDVMQDYGGSPTWTAREAVISGDANDSGEVDFFDGMIILQFYAGILDDTQLNVAAADVDGSGEVNFFDAMYVLQFYAGILEKLPV